MNMSNKNEVKMTREEIEMTLRDKIIELNNQIASLECDLHDKDMRIGELIERKNRLFVENECLLKVIKTIIRERV
jgi:regulator of replication initiation timing